MSRWPTGHGYYWLREANDSLPFTYRPMRERQQQSGAGCCSSMVVDRNAQPAQRSTGPQRQTLQKLKLFKSMGLMTNVVEHFVFLMLCSEINPETTRDQS
jgi:hypothetical protein